MKARALAACILAFISSGCKENERPTPDAQSSSTATWQLNDSGRWIVSLEGTKSDSNLQQAIAASLAVTLVAMAVAVRAVGEAKNAALIAEVSLQVLAAARSDHVSS